MYKDELKVKKLGKFDNYRHYVFMVFRYDLKQNTNKHERN